MVQHRLSGLFLSCPLDVLARVLRFGLRSRVLAFASAAVVVSALAGCAVTDSARGVQRFIDPHTAVTVQAMAEPWVYAREVRGLAVNQRDYRSIGVVEVNRQGARAYYLGVIAWSTIDRSGLPRPVLPRGLRWAGDEAKTREPVGTDLASIGVSTQPFAPPAGYLGEAWYRVSAAEVRAFAQVPAWIEVVEGDEVQRYERWKGGPELAAPLLERMP